MSAQDIEAPELLIKQSVERLKYSMDFTNRIGSGITIASVGITSETVGDADSDLTIDNISISGKKILLRIAGGTSGTSYTVHITCTLSNDEILKGSGMLRVVDA
jgi:hypothetical protein